MRAFGKDGKPAGIPPAGVRSAGRLDAIARFTEPGRAAFELSLAGCALSLAFPWLVVGSLGAALRAARRGSRRAWVLLPCCLWCCLLGLGVRQYLGMGLFP